MIQDEPHWYALHVKPHKERAVYEQLIARDITAYYPHMRVKPKNPRSRKERPYFPGYLFARINLIEHGTNALSWIPGSHRLVEFGGQPAIVPDQLLTQLQETIATQHDVQPTLNKFKKGDKIRIIGGTLDGYEAIFDTHLADKDRVQVLLSFLSSYPQPLQLDAEDIQIK